MPSEYQANLRKNKWVAKLLNALIYIEKYKSKKYSMSL